MSSFWDRSWSNIDPARISEYVMTIDMGEDDLIAVLRQHGVHTVCDAGCGCGIYSLKLAANGFVVSGFDVSARAVEIAQVLLDGSAFQVDLKTASVLATMKPSRAP